ncbi:photosystem II reaction center PsbP family protein, partial [Micromonospora phytophila]|uniref:PsbP-related protein n=1 Tax=Micromonospora phytophila TaxID=709888 RepID=UPI00202F48E8
LHTPTGAMPAPAGPATTGRTYGGGSDATQRIGSADTTQRIGTGTPGPARFGGQPEATQRIGGTYGGGQWSVPGTGQAWTSPATAPGAGDAGGPLGGVRGAGNQFVRTVKGWPRKVQVAVAGGLAVVLLIAAVALSGGGDEPPPAAPQAVPTTAAPAGVPPEMKEHVGKGVRVMVPQGWERKSAGDWVDYVDPQDDGRKVRILVEKFGTTSTRWAEVAENGLRTRAKSCVKPYAQIAMTENELAGKPAAEFEYTCGEGDAKRHGVWRGVVHDGKAYSFYLTATDAKFAESKPIFDEMVQSFQLTEAG